MAEVKIITDGTTFTSSDISEEKANQILYYAMSILYPTSAFAEIDDSTPEEDDYAYYML
jgi:hypothetical protein